MESSPGDVTRLLQAMRSGDEKAEAELMRLIHPELRKLAARCLRAERPDHTLQATELVNEVYLRLLGHTRDLQNRAHFRAVAAHAMRNILVDHARARHARKRGGDMVRIDLDAAGLGVSATDERVLALDEALSRLSQWDPRQARVVQLRFFGGMTDEEIAEVLGMSTRTVKRDWRQARAWLYSEIGT